MEERKVVNLLDHLHRQFAYDAWANREVLKTMRSGGPDPRSLQLMNHIVAAEQVWLDRLLQQPQSIAVWPNLDFAGCEARVEALARDWERYLSAAPEPDLTQSISYKNSKGECWNSTVQDVLTHVLMHSTYHRGQIASHTREIGRTPAYTDFIGAVREGHVR